ncbi:zinc-binding dehydrogenase [Salirhabdus salicampi]|uniref:zinc-binding dehydrogenase n=1 Tax=Salirhabdus salicampi TaxID=476102 RepID=UPI0020C490B4|nr:zinc-binding dehydrogenase [Salirhabdus salicampi]MCP8615473.1 zinc-binding dehydrogenase [Salirhabdus salicampi]
MNALIHHGPTGLRGVKYGKIDDGQPGKHEVKIKLKSAGINHRDLFVPNRRTAEAQPLVLGSDGAGVVEEVGEEVTNVKVGDKVIINPGIGWRNNSDAPPEEFEILGFPDHGTFAENIVIRAENVVPKPSFLTWEEAGALPLAALTAYRVLFSRANAKADQTIFVPGIGSGVATFLLQFAKAIGARVIVTSRQEAKLQKAKEIGADRVIHTNDNWEQQLADETIDIVIESVGAATFNRSLSVLRKGGTMVTFGASAGDEVQLNIRSFFYGQYSLLGSTMGSHEEFLDMLNFIDKHEIKPIIDSVYPLSKALESLKYLDKGEQFGKIVLDPTI